MTRQTAEQPEAVEAGTLELVGTDVDHIVSACAHLLNDASHFKKMSEVHNPYGDGQPASRIADIMVAWLVTKID